MCSANKPIFQSVFTLTRCCTPQMGYTMALAREISSANMRCHLIRFAFSRNTHQMECHRSRGPKPNKNETKATQEWHETQANCGARVEWVGKTKQSNENDWICYVDSHQKHHNRSFWLAQLWCTGDTCRHEQLCGVFTLEWPQNQRKMRLSELVY